MYEMPFAESIISVALDVAGDEHVWRITVRIGALHAVDPDSLRYAYQLVSEGTQAASAQLDLSIVPVTLFCRECRECCRQVGPQFCCVRCGGVDIELRNGDEFLVDAIELDDGWRRRPLPLAA